VSNSDIQKEKIRNKYKGVNPDELDIIPAIPQAGLYDDKNEKRVAVYARVSTDDPSQTSSYELQKNHYMDLVNQHAGWKLVDIYADEGISGTSLRHRDSFIRMINDCRAGKIDLIITKTVARFARNLMDCIGYVRELKQLQPPVGVSFEAENIYTLGSNSEMLLAFMAVLAQEESHNKSEIMNSSIEMRFKRGIFLTPPLLGYDKDEDGNLVISEEEAKIVRLIFFMYLYGYTCQEIAETLTKLDRRTKKGNTAWSAGAILQILQNERHCGDVLARKTWTPNYLDHKSKKNKQNRNQYLKKNHHESIISRDDFIAVQRLISNAKYGHKGFLPELKVVPDGVLKGFVSINPRWAAFEAKDYQDASDSVYISNEDWQDNIEIEVQSGDFDLRKFEVARSQFFDTANKTCATFSLENIQFSSECVRKFDKTLCVEMLVNPNENLFAVRPCSNIMRNAIQWAKLKNGLYYSRNISCTAYIKTLYELFGWNSGYKYRVRGIRRQKDDEILIIFDMNETEIFISQNEIISDFKKNSSNEQLESDIQPFTNGPNKDIMAFPTTWANTFGNNYYRQMQARELAILNGEKEWKTKEEGKPYSKEGLKITSSDEIQQNIQKIISDMEQEVTNDEE
jgi:DNA invertase Pin-like site-specific DNA recombinase